MPLFYQVLIIVGRCVLPQRTRLAVGPFIAKWFPKFYGQLDNGGGPGPVLKEYVSGHQQIYTQWLAQQCQEPCDPNEDLLSRFLVLVDTSKFKTGQLQKLAESLQPQATKFLQIWLVDEFSTSKSLPHGFNRTVKKSELDDALESATYDYLLVVHTPGYFSTGALLKMSNQLPKDAGISIFYSDHDFIDSSGLRCLPSCKPSWNLDYLLSYNYIGGVVGFSRSFLQSQLKHTRLEEFLNDLYVSLIRVSDTLNVSTVCHIPLILFHQYIPDEANGDRESSAILQAVQTSFPEARVHAITESNTQRIYWPLPLGNPLVSIIIPAYNQVALTRACIDSIFKKTTYDNFEVILIDNRSDDPTMLAYLETIKGHSRIEVISDDRPFNFSALNNQAVKGCEGDVLLFLNNDTEVINAEWLTELVSQATRQDIGCVGAKLYFTDGRIQHGGVIVGYGGVAGHSHKFFPGDHPGYMNRLACVQNFSAITAACMAIRREVFEQVGGFDEQNLAVAFNDVDLCLKVQEAGFRNLWTPFAELYHHESVSRDTDQVGEGKRRFEKEIEFMKRRWKTHEGCDPAYNPNLAINREDFAMRVEEL